MNERRWLGTFLLLLPVGCGDDSTQTEDSGSSSSGDTSDDGVDSSDSSDPDATTGEDTTSTTDADGSTDSSDSADGSSSDDGPPPGEPAEFFVRIENVSADSVITTSLSPGVWLEHTIGSQPIFSLNLADRGEGLEALAEDGDPSALAQAVMNIPEVLQSGTFAGEADAPIAPGASVEWTFVAQPGSRLSLQTMLGESNDIVIGTGPVGVSLFTNANQPQAERDISDLLGLWDVGTEANQPLGMGGYQAARQLAPGEGMPETGAVLPFRQSTRVVPQAGAFVSVDVTRDEDTFTITLTNVSAERGTLVSPLSPVAYALHDDTASLFTRDTAASPELEALAEEGDPSSLVTALTGAAGIVSIAATEAGAGPGESVVLTVTPTDAAPLLSFATMVGESNDAFLATPPAGIALLDANGSPRQNGAIEQDLARFLAVWDAGTEINEVPGVGPNQPARSEATGTDEDGTIVPFLDLTNDLAGPGLGGFVSVDVVPGDSPDELIVTLTNTSGDTSYPGLVSPMIYILHDATFELFESGAPASEGLALLASDGDPDVLYAELDGAAGLGDFGLVEVPDGSEDPGPLAPGESYSINLFVDGTYRFVNIVAMVQPSNDTFVAFPAGGLVVADEAGNPLSEEVIAASIDAELQAWDAGSEANQAGAAGASMAPTATGTGLPEGSGLVRAASDDGVWVYPLANDLVRVTVGPTGR